jgi:hypothetical protein
MAEIANCLCLHESFGKLKNVKRVVQNTKEHNLYLSSDILRVIKSRSMIWIGSETFERTVSYLVENMKGREELGM